MSRLLVVDDNPEYGSNLKEVLTQAGHDVLVYSSFAEVESAQDATVDVALVDLKLPDGDGMALAEKVKDKNPDCEVVLLTGFASVESAAAAVRAGAWAYLVKPCPTKELLLTVDHAARQVALKQERRALQRRAQVAEKLAAVGTLTAGLTHEIRNPLNAAALQLSVLERRVRKLDPEAAQPLLEPLTLVRDEIQRLDHVLRDFLLFARPVPLQQRPVELCQVLNGVQELLRRDAAQRGLALSLRCPAAVQVLGDEGRLRQAFLNLVINALEATPRGGSVSVEAHVDHDWVVARVDDTGPGIEPEALARIFEPFYSTKEGGSGLGLPIVHAVVTQHGGSITPGASPVGGARMEVRLPCAKA